MMKLYTCFCLYRSPSNYKEKLVKRIAGLPGDLIHLPSLDIVRVPQGHCWIVGDNSACSLDSRSFGPVWYTILLLCTHIHTHTFNIVVLCLVHDLGRIISQESFLKRWLHNFGNWTYVYQLKVEMSHSSFTSLFHASLNWINHTLLIYGLILDANIAIIALLLLFLGCSPNTCFLGWHIALYIDGT